MFTRTTALLRFKIEPLVKAINLGDPNKLLPFFHNNETVIQDAAQGRIYMGMGGLVTFLIEHFCDQNKKLRIQFIEHTDNHSVLVHLAGASSKETYQINYSRKGLINFVMVGK